MKDKEIVEQMRTWAKDWENQSSEKLVYMALQKYNEDVFNAVHWTELIDQYSISQEEREKFIKAMKIAWDKQEPFEKKYLKMAIKVIDELE